MVAMAIIIIRKTNPRFANAKQIENPVRIDGELEILLLSCRKLPIRNAPKVINTAINLLIKYDAKNTMQVPRLDAQPIGSLVDCDWAAAKLILGENEKIAAIRQWEDVVCWGDIAASVIGKNTRTSVTNAAIAKVFL